MIRMEIDRRTRRQFERTLRQFRRATGVSVEEGIIEVAKSTARQLVHTVQPYGTDKAKGEKFMGNIGKQIDYAWMGSLRGAYPSSSMAEAHAAARNSRGVVRMRKFRRFAEWNNYISVGQKEEYKRKKVKNAGIAKAGWVVAGESTISATNRTRTGRVKKLSGIANWIRRHMKPSLGGSEIKRNGMGTFVDLINNVSYIEKLQTQSDVNKAIRVGLSRGMARLRKIIAALNR